MTGIPPFVPKLGSSSSSSSRKRPCKYGPRDAEGYCPKKPASARTSRGKPPCKYGPRDAQGYCPKKPKNAAGRYGYSENVVTRTIVNTGGRMGGQAAAAAVEVALNPKARSMAKELAGISVSLIPAMTAVARRAIVGTILGAGLASYALTKWIIDKKARTREERAALAAKAARASVDARIALTQLKGAPLDKAELNQIADQFRESLRQLGLSTKELGKL